MKREAAASAPPSTLAREALTRWDGATLLAACAAGGAHLAARRDSVNALNVFPVPDGDTGDNMHLTMRAALDAARDLPADASAGEVAGRIARGALMGARGNSGVILSQILRGFANAIADRPEITAPDLARGLEGARALAYTAVVDPVEGTMLTTIRVAAEHAGAILSEDLPLADLFRVAVAGAAKAVAATPELLPILREANVVDAGGQGLLLLLEGMSRFADGEAPETSLRPVDREAPPGEGMAFLDRVAELHGTDAFGYCTDFIVIGEEIDVERCRAELASMGTSAVIVGDDTMLKVHLHTERPGQVLEYAIQLGELDRIKIDNMEQQTRTLTAERGGRVTAPAASPPAAPGPATHAIVAVAAAEGVAAALQSMGVTGIVVGGQTMNPSTEELLAGVEESEADEVILLPNNPNILLTANQVPALASKQVGVVPSRSLPQGLAALAAYQPDAALDVNVRQMTAALADVRTVEITRASREATIGSVPVGKGQVIGLLEDKLVVAGDDLIRVAADTVGRADLARAELVTIFMGEEVTAEQGEALRSALLSEFDGLTIELLEGRQSHYPFLIGVE